MRKAILLLLFIVICTANQANAGDGDVVNVWNGSGSNTNAVPTPIVTQPEKLTPIGAPWAASGVNDNGYCPLVWGWGWVGNMFWPVPNYTGTRAFGYLPGTTHAGLDIYAPEGSPVYAPTSGAIVWAGGNSTGFGNQTTGFVAIRSSGHTVILAHMASIAENLSCGVSVTRGQFVGTIGRSGAVAGAAHLHLEVRYNNYSWDPVLFFN